MLRRLIVMRWMHTQEGGAPMKFLPLADTYRLHGPASIRYSVLEVSATVGPFEIGRGFRLPVHLAVIRRAVGLSPAPSGRTFGECGIP